MAGDALRKVSASDVAPNRRRGGDIRILLSPGTVGATSGFMGVGTLLPGERVTEHLHPYSEEFLYVVEGTVQLAAGPDRTIAVGAGESLMVPRGMRHSLANNGPVPAFLVFHASPLAPEPRLGHVDTEPATGAGLPPAAVAEREERDGSAH